MILPNINLHISLVVIILANTKGAIWIPLEASERDKRLDSLVGGVSEDTRASQRWVSQGFLKDFARIHAPPRGGVPKGFRRLSRGYRHASQGCTMSCREFPRVSEGFPKGFPRIQTRLPGVYNVM